MSRWFRFYADAIRNPKVARLDDGTRWLWIELMAVASENDGRIPRLEDLKHVLKRRLDHLSRGLDKLISAQLIDPLADGYEPHNWRQRQYKSDVSTERVHKHRAKRNVSETPPETDTDTEDVIANAIPSKRARRAPVGIRIPDDWKPAVLPPTVAELVARWPDDRLKREQEGFHAYWKSRSRDACKLDWDLTWHNRIRDIHERVLRDSRNATQHIAPSGRVMGRTEAAARLAAERRTEPPPVSDSRVVSLPNLMRAVRYDG